MNIKFSFRNVIKVIVLISFIVFVGLQFIPTTRNESKTILESDFARTFDVPDDIQNLLKTSCNDCHSNNTRYPWYNRVQPAAWIMEGHIRDAKAELNFSEFGSYSKRRQKSKLKSIISQAKSGEMPLPSYTYIHWDAPLSEKQKKRLIVWLTKLRNDL